MKKLKTKAKIQNMTSSTGNIVPNQFEIFTDKGIFFQSYDSVIAFKEGKTDKIYLDENKWDYSTTTGTYRNQFLGETKKETQQKIDAGIYTLVDLN